MWRWSRPADQQFETVVVFSTYVEVILNQALRCLAQQGILHVCGGDPVKGDGKPVLTTYSPRMWRWSYVVNSVTAMGAVFSTYVEVILLEDWLDEYKGSILHVCGGDPQHA